MPRSLDDWLSFIDEVHPRDIALGLERMMDVAGRLDVKKPASRTVIVAGTNGKGSTSVALETLLLEQGFSVGTTLSPHVDRFNERIRVDGVELDDARLCSLFEAIEAVRGDVPLTYFEYSALAALSAFKSAAVDVAILEIGLGGRLDAFNVVDADLAIVTSIGLDHQDYLGADLETIGREKAGVFRPGIPVVLGRVTASVVKVATELNCEVFRIGTDFDIQETRSSWSYQSAALGLNFPDLERGALAPANCALALTAARLLTGKQDPGSAALASAALPGRMEQHDYQGVPVIVDVAHNPAAAEFLANQLGYRYPGQRFVAICGALKDKDMGGVMIVLAPQVRGWLTVATHGWREQSAESLAERLAIPGAACASMTAALARARSLTEAGDGILVLGSFSVVEQARKLLTEC